MTTAVQKISYQKIVVLFELALFVLFAGLYMYFINGTIHQVVERKTVIEETELLRASLASLEFEYISRSTSLDKELAVSLGFVEVTEPKFASRTGTKVLSLLDTSNGN